MFKKEDFERLKSLDEIATLSPRDFEWFSKFLLEKRGHSSVFVTQKHGEIGGDGGVDVKSKKDDLAFYTQCKKWSPTFRGTFKGFLPIRVVRELGGCMLRDKVNHGIIITTLTFESLGQREAKLMNIELIGREELVQEMQLINPAFQKRSYVTWRTRVWRILVGILRLFFEGLRALFFS